MASSHIELQGNESRLAGKFRSTGDWLSIKALFGFADEATAQAAYDLLAQAAIKINSAAIDNFVNRIG